MYGYDVLQLDMEGEQERAGLVQCVQSSPSSSPD